MNSDRILNVDRRTRLGYISLAEEEEAYVRSTINKMNQAGLNVGKNVGGKLARLSILLLCDMYNLGKLKSLSATKNESHLRENIQKLFKTFKQ